MPKNDDVQKEQEKLRELFRDAEPGKAMLAEGLIADAAFLFVENRNLREIMTLSGMVKVHPQHPEIQKQTEAAGQYLKNVNSYAVLIKALATILKGSGNGEEDPFDAFIAEYRGN